MFGLSAVFRMRCEFLLTINTSKFTFKVIQKHQVISFFHWFEKFFFSLICGNKNSRTWSQILLSVFNNLVDLDPSVFELKVSPADVKRVEFRTCAICSFYDMHSNFFNNTRRRTLNFVDIMQVIRTKRFIHKSSCQSSKNKNP